MKKILIWLFVVFAFSPYLYANEGKLCCPLTPPPAIALPAVALPDISIIGDIVGTFSEDKDKTDRNRIVVRKIELALQGYLMPGMRADVFMALERKDGEYKAKICEAFVSFLTTPIPGLSVMAGKQLLRFGKLNPVHAHHWNFVDRPAVLRSYFGDHGLVGQGINFSYLLPLPFFAQWDVGAWYIDAPCPPKHHHGHNHNHNHHNHHHHLGLAGEAFSTRLWTSFALALDRELEIGLSGVKGFDAIGCRDRVKIGGLDLTYRHFGLGARRWLFQNELLYLNKRDCGGDLSRWGFYSLLNYRFDRFWDVGLRYDWLETPFGGCVKEESSISMMLTYTLTCTTKLRLQHQFDLEENEHTVFLQLTFGIGPHAHPLE